MAFSAVPVCIGAGPVIETGVVESVGSPVEGLAPAIVPEGSAPAPDIADSIAGQPTDSPRNEIDLQSLQSSPQTVREALDSGGSEAGLGAAAGREFDRTRQTEAPELTPPEAADTTGSDGALGAPPLQNAGAAGQTSTRSNGAHPATVSILSRGRGGPPAFIERVKRFFAAAGLMLTAAIGPDSRLSATATQAPDLPIQASFDRTYLRPNASTLESSAQATQALQGLEDRYWEASLKASDATAFRLGLAPRKDSNGPACEDWDAAAESLAKFKTQLHEFESDWSHAMTPQQRVDVELLRRLNAYQLDWIGEQKGYRKSLDNFIGGPLGEIHKRLTYAEEGRGTAQGWAKIEELLKHVPDRLYEGELLMRDGLHKGDVPNRLLVEMDGLQAAENAARYYETELPKKAESELGRDDPQARAVRTAGAAAAEAVLRFAGFLKDEALPKAQDDIYVGPNAVHHDLSSVLAMDEDPWLVYQRLGRRFQELNSRLERVRKEILRSAKGPDALKKLDAQLLAHPKDDEEMLEAYRDSVDRAGRFIREKDLFDLPEDYEVNVELAPDALSQMGAAFIQPVPPFRDDVQGTFFVPPSHGNDSILRTRTFASIASSAAHEALPGHDLQFRMMRQERESIPKLRWLFPADPNNEGWAEYSTELLRKAGYFTPLEDYSYTSNERGNALYAYWDLGLHAGYLSRKDVFKDLTSGALGDRLSEKQARDMLYRMTKMPLQSTYYVLGEMEIEALKSEYQRKLGRDFTESGFHEWFFGQGPIPIRMMRWALDETPKDDLP